MHTFDSEIRILSLVFPSPLTTNRCQAWHSTGRYLLSAGHDQVINLVSPLSPPEKYN